MLYSKGGIYHAIYHWYIAIYKVVYTLLFNTAPLLCYKLFNTARCYVTSYLTLLYNMLNHTFWPERALPACLSTPPPLPAGPRCPECAPFAQQCLFTVRQGHGLIIISISIILRLTIRPRSPLLRVAVAARAGR